MSKTRWLGQQGQDTVVLVLVIAAAVAVLWWGIPAYARGLQWLDRQLTEQER